MNECDELYRLVLFCLRFPSVLRVQFTGPSTDHLHGVYLPLLKHEATKIKTINAQTCGLWWREALHLWGYISHSLCELTV